MSNDNGKTDGDNKTTAGTFMPALPPMPSMQAMMPATATMHGQPAGETPAAAEVYAPNSMPRENPPAASSTSSPPENEKQAPIETYVYRDFANVADPSIMLGGATGPKGNNDASSPALLVHGDGKIPPQSLQSQKLPSKLNCMLSDPDLASIITWMPHGRSWKILNRELFASFALPRYFGHSNHASFVRIVNAWGFRRISVGMDRDSYYHELFLRGKPQLHQRMKRLPSCHRKTPVDKDDRAPNFYELSKVSPLPEVTWGRSGGGAPQALNPVQAAAAGVAPMGGAGAFPPAGLGGMMPNNGLMGNQLGGVGNGMGASGMNNPMLSLLSSGGDGGGQLAAYAQNLQRENENLMLRIKLLEYNNQMRQGGNSNTDAYALGGSAFGNNMMGGGGGMAGTSAPAFKQEGNANGNMNSSTSAGTGATTAQLLEQEIAMMQRGYGAGNSGMMNQGENATSLLQLAGGSGGAGGGNGNNHALSGQQGQNQGNTSFPSNAGQGGGDGGTLTSI